MTEPASGVLGDRDPGVLASFRLDRHVAVVTGGGSGLGRAISLGLAEAGARVVVVGRRVEQLTETVELIKARGGRADAVPHDLSDVAAIPDLFDRVTRTADRLDILVNNAGMTIVKPSLDLTLEEWDDVVNLNLRSAFFCSVEAVRRYARQGSGGVILNVASIGALRASSGAYTAYSASKGGLVSLTRAHAAEWASRRVRVNCVAVGAFRTEMSDAAYRDPAIHARYIRRIPLGRTAEPHELAPLALYLCSPASGFVTGETVVIDGGQVIR